MVSFRAHETHTSGGNLTRELLCGHVCFFGNCLCTSGYVLRSKQLLRRFPALCVTAGSYVVAALCMLVTCVLLNSNAYIVAFLCPDCTSAWAVPQRSMVTFAVLGPVPVVRRLRADDLGEQGRVGFIGQWVFSVATGRDRGRACCGRRRAGVGAGLHASQEGRVVFGVSWRRRSRCRRRVRGVYLVGGPASRRRHGAVAGRAPSTRRPYYRRRSQAPRPRRGAAERRAALVLIFV